MLKVMQRLTVLLREVRLSFWIQKWSLIRLLHGLSPVFQQHVVLSSLITEILYSASSPFENTWPKIGTCFFQHSKGPSQCIFNSSALLSRASLPLILQKISQKLIFCVPVLVRNAHSLHNNMASSNLWNSSKYASCVPSTLSDAHMLISSFLSNWNGYTSTNCRDNTEKNVKKII